MQQIQMEPSMVMKKALQQVHKSEVKPVLLHALTLAPSIYSIKKDVNPFPFYYIKYNCCTFVEN